VKRALVLAVLLAGAVVVTGPASAAPAATPTPTVSTTCGLPYVPGRRCVGRPGYVPGPHTVPTAPRTTRAGIHDPRTAR
jgi:hypothetical protein